MNDESVEYEQTLSLLLAELASHPVVIEFKIAEQRLKADERLYTLEKEMKALAKDAVLYKKIGKERAYHETLAQSQAIELDLNEAPVLIDYRRKMLAVTDLLQHVLHNLETEINEELYHEN